MGKTTKIICPACQTTNGAEANFCLHCSQRISQVCPRCSRRMVSQANFCDRCGFSLKNIQLQDPGNLVSSQPFQPARQTADEVDPIGNTPTPPEKLDPLPAVDEEDKSKQPEQAAAPLERYSPKELLGKLEKARAS